MAALIRGTGSPTMLAAAERCSALAQEPPVRALGEQSAAGTARRRPHIAGVGGDARRPVRSGTSVHPGRPPTRRIDLVSRRVGNYQYSPQWGILLDQLWVR